MTEAALSADDVAEQVLVGYVDGFGEITLDVGLPFRGWRVVLLPPKRHSDGPGPISGDGT